MATPTMFGQNQAAPVVGGGPNPLDFFTNVWAWYDTSQETAYSDGDGMSQWTDWSGNGRHRTQATSANRPRYIANYLNSKPIVRFDQFGGTNRFFTGPSMAAITVVHRLTVLLMDSDTSDTFGVCNGPWNMTADTSNDVYFAYGGDNKIYESFGSTARKAFTKSGITLNSWRSYDLKSDSGLYAPRLDKTALTPNLTNTVGFNSTHEIGRTLFSRYAFFRMAEDVICTSLQDSTAFDAWIDYVNDKWALGIS